MPQDIDFLSALLAQRGIPAIPSVDDYEPLIDDLPQTRPGFAYQSMPGNRVRETPYAGANLGGDDTPSAPLTRGQKMMSTDPYSDDLQGMAAERTASAGASPAQPPLPLTSSGEAPKIDVDKILGGDTSRDPTATDYQYDLGELINGKPGETPEQTDARKKAQGRELLNFGLKLMAQSGGPNSKGLLGDVGVAGSSTLQDMDARKQKSVEDAVTEKKQRTALELEAEKGSRDQYNKDRDYGVNALKANTDAAANADLMQYRRDRLGQYDKGIDIEKQKADAAVAAADGKSGGKGSADIQMINHLKTDLGWGDKRATDFVVSQHPDFTKAFQTAYSSIANSPAGFGLPPDQLFQQAMKMAKDMTAAQSQLPTPFTQYSGASDAEADGETGIGTEEDPEEIRKKAVTALLRSNNFLDGDTSDGTGE